MALAAICPHCQTMFRVASDQLKLRGGIVRCGACHEVFDGNAALVDLEAIPVQAQASDPQHGADAVTHSSESHAGPLAPADDEASAPADAHANTDPDAAISALPVLDNVVENPRDPDDSDSQTSASASAHQPHDRTADEAPSLLDTAEASATESDAGAAPGPFEYTLDFDTTLPESSGVSGDAPIDAFEELVALPAPEDDGGDTRFGETAHDSPPLPPGMPSTPSSGVAVDSLAPLLTRASAAGEDRPGTPSVLPAGAQAQAQSRARRAKAAAERRPAIAAPPEVVAPPEPAPDDEPEFVRRSRQQEASGERRRLLLLAACAVLALAMLVQGVWSFRNTLAARYPGARPLLGGLCAVMGCKVELPAQIDALAVETGELQTIDASTFSLVTLLRNQGDLVQAWPHLELALTDANDKTLVRRVFAPAEYLPPGTMAARGFAARSEQSIKLSFQLDQIKASGYHLAIFYP